MVLDPSNPVNNAALDSQVQYAMEMTTVDGTGTAAAYGLGSRQIIAKTGTTSGSTAGFFIGAIPQYSLVVGMFVANPANTSESLVPLTGGGFGGYWPAKIWNTFAQAEFANLPQQTFQNPVFSGANWNQVGKQPTAHDLLLGRTARRSRCTSRPARPPTPRSDCGYDQQTGQNDLCSTCSFNQADGQFDNCRRRRSAPTTRRTGSSTSATAPRRRSATCQYQGDPACNGATPSPSGTCQNPGRPRLPASGNGTSTPSASGTQAGLAVGGGLARLPGAGSALWADGVPASRRRRRAGAAR